MKAVVMAGGYGTRLRPLTIKRPKPMMPVAGRPMLEHIVRLLVRHGFRRILMLTYFFPETIEEHFGDGRDFGAQITYHQDPPGGLGTAGAVRGVSEVIDGPFLIISGDVITDFDLTHAWEFHREREEMATMVLTRVHNPLPFGVVITDEDDQVTRFLEKPTWGEVFSDTINTGIYIMEPEILDRIPEGVSSDFSRDIFPRLLDDGQPLGAYVAQGYWKDVGNAVEYLQLHREISAGTISLDIPGDMKVLDEAVLYLGKGAQVSEEAWFSGTVVLGDGVKVSDGCRIRDSFLGHGVTVEPNVRMRSSVVWNDALIGRGCFVAGSVIGSRTQVRIRANIEEGSVISEDCIIGRGSIIQAGVRIWPEKVVEDGAVLSNDFIWGSRWRGTLFTGGIISGLANREITPEFAARLGASFGALFPEHSTVSLSRGIHRSSRMISEAISSGILSVGVGVHEASVIPIPVARHLIRAEGDVGGMHVRRTPTDPEILEIRLFGEDGRELSASQRGEIDRLFFRMDFRRASIENSGSILAPEYGSESYEKAFLKNLDLTAVSRSRMRLIVDYAFGTTIKILPALLGRTGAEVVSLNSHIDEERVIRTTRQFDRAVGQVSEYVQKLEANLGAILSTNGETLTLIDERGRWIDGGKMLQILALLAFRMNPGCTVAVPANASGNLEKLALEHDASVIRTPISTSAILDAAYSGSAFLAGNLEGGVAFPDFHPSFDAMFCLLKTMEMMVASGARLGDLVDSLPEAYLQHSIVPCAWEAKGQVMRTLIEELGEETKAIEGVRLEDDDGWVLIYPSSNHACFHIYGESPKEGLVTSRLQTWARKIEKMQVA
ncbi:MAG: NTP transferase domain-containing protein [bacterium]|nr:MAG: NTP transferase domain-containing protein [bacterium]